MNKILTICIGFLIASIANAQTPGESKPEIVLEGGVKADATFLNFQKAGAPGAFSSFTPGFTPGGFMNIWFNDWIGIRPELNLNFKQTVLGWASNSGKLQSFGVEVHIPNSYAMQNGPLTTGKLTFLKSMPVVSL